MAQSTAFKSYDAVGNRESLTNDIANITRHETPLFSGLPKGQATNRVHSWQTDTLTTGSDNAQIEGSDYTFSLAGASALVTNYTQIFDKTVEVSRTQRLINTAGREDDFEYQLEKRMKEIATDVEQALITGTGNSGASGTARRMVGFLAAITTNVETGTGTGNESLTETMFNDALQDVYDAGGEVEEVQVNSWQKRKISSFATSNQRYYEIDESDTLRNRVGVYVSDFGRHVIKWNKFMPTDKVLLLDKRYAKIAMLDDLHMEEVAKVGKADRAAITGELTLEYGNQAALGQITQLSTT